MKKGSLLIKNADYVVTCDSLDRVFEKADVLIDDERIVAVRGRRYWQAAGITSVGSDERKIVKYLWKLMEIEILMITDGFI